MWKSSKFFLMSCNKFSVCFTYFSIRQRFPGGNDALSLSLGRTKELSQGLWEWGKICLAKGATCANPRRNGEKELGNELMLNKSGWQPKIWSAEARARRGAALWTILSTCDFSERQRWIQESDVQVVVNRGRHSHSHLSEWCFSFPH